MAIDFWFSIGSTYSFLPVMRLDRIAADIGLQFNWRVFNVRRMMKGMNNIPFADKPAKLAYMWRDLERRAEGYGLATRLPAPYPISDLERANRVALLGLEEGWGKAYVQASYRRWFHDGEDAGAEPNLSASLAEAGQDPATTLARADAEPVARALDKATDEAMALGLFGAPSFTVGGELFWGDDRLDDAIAWHSRQSLP